MSLIYNVLKVTTKNKKTFLIIADELSILLSYVFAYYVLMDSDILPSAKFVINLWPTVLFAILFYPIFLNLFDVYSNIIRYENGRDYLKYIRASLLGVASCGIVEYIYSSNGLNIKTHFLASIIITMITISYRVTIRFILTKNKRVTGKNKEQVLKAKNILIIGAGDSARNIINAVQSGLNDEYNIVGMIDDNKEKLNKIISGVRVIGNRRKIIDICKKYSVDQIFYTISRIAAKDQKEILDMCQNTGAKLRILPSTQEYIKSGKSILEKLKDVEIDDVLYRDPIILDNNNISKLIEDQVILVTGGGGSIGSELCRQIINYNPKKLVILDIYENSLYDIELELKKNYSQDMIDIVVGSIRDEKALERVFIKYRPYMVFHAAAHKHVPLMEANPIAAIKNNVFGTYYISDLADRFSVKKFVLVSTDKAVNPTNVMGATKRLDEMIIQAKNKVSKTDFVAVRFGNVLGSNGSVIPLFKKQIAAGGPVTVTHKEITRYFMTIPEAVSLILQATTYAEGGEIFVLDMGEPVKIYDLAVSLIKLSGLEPNVDIPIDVIGLRPGEKLYEELLMDEEGLNKTRHEKIFTAKPSEITMADIEQKIDILNKAILDETVDIKEIKEALMLVVPTYRISGGKG